MDLEFGRLELEPAGITKWRESLPEWIHTTESKAEKWCSRGDALIISFQTLEPAVSGFRLPVFPGYKYIVLNYLFSFPLCLVWVDGILGYFQPQIIAMFTFSFLCLMYKSDYFDPKYSSMPLISNCLLAFRKAHLKQLEFQIKRVKRKSVLEKD